MMMRPGPDFKAVHAACLWYHDRMMKTLFAVSLLALSLGAARFASAGADDEPMSADTAGPPEVKALPTEKADASKVKPRNPDGANVSAPANDPSRSGAGNVIAPANDPSRSDVGNKNAVQDHDFGGPGRKDNQAAPAPSENEPETPASVASGIVKMYDDLSKEADGLRARFQKEMAGIAKKISETQAAIDDTAKKMEEASADKSREGKAFYKDLKSKSKDLAKDLKAAKKAIDAKKRELEDGLREMQRRHSDVMRASFQKVGDQLRKSQ
jgi:hypothetical protein